MKTLPAGVIRWGKIPVPYVASWSSEQGWRAAADARAERKLCLYTATGRRGLGTPMFGKMDPARVREVILERRCQVCRSPLNGIGYVADVVRGQHGRAPIVNEPPACRRCFEQALLLCPGIRRQWKQPRFLAAVVRRYEALLVQMRPAESGDHALNAVLEQHKTTPVYGYARPALIDWEPIELAALTPEGGSPQ